MAKAPLLVSVGWTERTAESADWREIAKILIAGGSWAGSLNSCREGRTHKGAREGGVVVCRGGPIIFAASPSVLIANPITSG